MDLDPGGPKTCESGSPTLVESDVVAGLELGGLRDDRSPEPTAEVRVPGLLLPHLQVPAPEWKLGFIKRVTVQIYRTSVVNRKEFGKADNL
jgi:hypothetical protein